MKLTKIALACTAALCGTQAQAHIANQPHDTTILSLAQIVAIPPSNQIFISGASAQQKTLGKIATGMLDHVTVIYDKPVTGTSGKNYRSYAGVVKAGLMTAGFAPGTAVIIHNRAKGGSFFGVNPVFNRTPIDFMKVDTNTTNCVQVNPFVADGPNFTCKDLIVGGQIPTAGVSDVEPKMFQGINVASGDVALPSGSMFSGGGSQYAVVFGPAVNKSGVTNLNRAQVNSMLSGIYTDWSQVSSTLAAGPITVCRRVNGSGTQAAYNAHFQGFGCSLSPQVPVDGTSANVIENSTSGDVVNCLNTHAGSIGTLSLENVRKTDGTDLWDFVKLDGVDPKIRANVIAGDYDFFVEQSIQWREPLLTPGGSLPNGPFVSTTPDQAKFLEVFQSRSGDPLVLAGLPGVYALPTVAIPGGADVLNGTRFGDTCAALQVIYPFAP